MVRTYAPIGQTPVLQEQATRDHLSVMSAITLEGKLLMMEQDRAFKGPDVVRFLKHALSEIPGKLLIIWDGSQIHRSREVKEFLKGGAASRIQLEQLIMGVSCPGGSSLSTSDAHLLLARPLTYRL